MYATMGAGTGWAGWASATLEKIRVGMAHPGNFSRGLKTSWLVNESIVMRNLCAWYSFTSMLLTHHNNTLNTYLVDANLRMAKLLNKLTYLFLFLRDSMYAKRAYAIAILSVCLSVSLSVRLSVTRVIHAKTAEVRIMQFSPYSSPIPYSFSR